MSKSKSIKLDICAFYNPNSVYSRLTVISSLVWLNTIAGRQYFLKIEKNRFSISNFKWQISFLRFDPNKLFVKKVVKGTERCCHQIKSDIFCLPILQKRKVPGQAL